MSLTKLCSTSERAHLAGLLMAVVWLMLLSGCAGSPYAPSPVEEVPFMERSQTQVKNNIRVTTSVPSAAETRALFDVSLYKRGVQPVWLKIDNFSDEAMNFLPVGLDPEYLSPIGAATLTQRNGPKPAMALHFFKSGMRVHVYPGETVSGFMFTRLDEGTKAFNVDIVGEEGKSAHFTFFIPVPGLQIDHQNVDFEALYSASDIVEYDADGLITALRGMPCCTTDKKSKDQGDPLNIVVIGDTDDVYYSFIRAGWDETETIYAGSGIRTVLSFFSGGEYRYSPVSGLYVLGRTQDVALQKARDNIHERNHLRLWMTPMRFEGKPVWIGQISRDIGVRFTMKTITTHKIDSDVDETREYLLENLAYHQALVKIAYVDGVGAAPIEAPRHNLTGDPYFTDGLRVVLWVSTIPVDIGDIETKNWITPY
jgi:hypothetical protein